MRLLILWSLVFWAILVVGGFLWYFEVAPRLLRLKIRREIKAAARWEKQKLIDQWYDPKCKVCQARREYDTKKFITSKIPLMAAMLAHAIARRPASDLAGFKEPQDVRS